MQRKPTVLLADADVLIDYRESDLAILALVARHLGRLAVLPSVLDEVRGVTAEECGRLGIEIVEVETERSRSTRMSPPKTRCPAIFECFIRVFVFFHETFIQKLGTGEHG